MDGAGVSPAPIQADPGQVQGGSRVFPEKPTQLGFLLLLGCTALFAAVLFFAVLFVDRI
jgi:hypothetical protein